MAGAPVLGAEKVVKIGMDLSLTGADSEGAIRIRNGIMMAIDAVNEVNGIPGYKIEPMLLDDGTSTAGQYDPAQAATNARKMVSDQEVVGALGPEMSGAGKAMAPILSMGGLATITPTSTNPDISDPTFAQQFRPAGKPIYFRTVTTDAYQGPNMANFYADVLKVKSVYILDDSGAYGVIPEVIKGGGDGVVGPTMLTAVGYPANEGWYGTIASPHVVGDQKAQSFVDASAPAADAGSCIIVVGTDVPLDHRQLGRVARRTGVGLARCGSFWGNGSGDIALAFTITNRVPHDADQDLIEHRVLVETRIDRLFQAAAEATQEAVLDALAAAESVVGRSGHRRLGLIEQLNQSTTTVRAPARLLDAREPIGPHAAGVEHKRVTGRNERVAKNSLPDTIAPKLASHADWPGTAPVLHTACHNQAGPSFIGSVGNSSIGRSEIAAPHWPGLYIISSSDLYQGFASDRR
jgi:hypothetical protein